uniref:ATPase associated with various cellular activities, AAA_5 n=1 Tax=uncultured bacterium A1Q1_fos_2286 TaxID=1256566 RepID=L7VZV7_9BACT|nr:ATPase associated with various cellular activities, AAA_5 [uncultured bacterium A1Q1_fos_2286]
MVAEAARRTIARRELAGRERFSQLSPELGQLDESAFDELLGADPDEALGLLADMAAATDQLLREGAHRLAGRIVVDLARSGRSTRRPSGRLVRRPPRDQLGDLDVDASLDEIVRARSGRLPVDPASLAVASWERPDTAVCLLVDRSGSMHGERLAIAALAAAAVMLRAPQRCSVVAFAQEAVVLVDESSTREPDRVVGDLLQLRGSGVTDVGLALRAAGALLERSDAPRRLTILLSDCRVTTGGDPVADALALDELAIIAPAGDSAGAEALASVTGARLGTVQGVGDVVDALAVALTP